MPAYLIANIRVDDPASYEEYKLAVPALIRKHGGEYVVRGGEPEVVEGDWIPSRLVILRFPDRAAAHRLLDDPRYRAIVSIRHSSAESSVVIVDGVEPGGVE